MLEALREAEAAGARGEVPVGCVISLNGAIIARGSNTTETDKHVCAHAELHAIRAASAVVGDWRLTECVLCVTLEPCTMCLGAIRLARIPVIIFGAGDSRQGAAGSLFDLSADERLGPPPRVIRGVKREECEMVLKRFFEQLRPGR
jgi:tRNA(adenine34) deaminase